ncbi:unnamed protein product, partial [Heterosigma akashiwo]
LGLNGLGKVSLGGATSALRFFRLGRLVKLAKRMKTLYKLLTQIIQSLKQVGNIILILFLFLYIFSLLGMQFFAYQFTFDEDGTRIQYDPTIEQDYWTPRVNFDNLFNALMAVFQIVTGEDYNLVMYDAVRARGYPAALFFVAALTLGNVIVLNMFLASLRPAPPRPPLPPPTPPTRAPGGGRGGAARAGGWRRRWGLPGGEGRGGPGEDDAPPARKLPALEQVRGKTEPAGQLLRYKSIGQLQEEMMAAATSLGAAEEEGKREHSENPSLTPPQQPNTEQPDLIDKEQEDGPSLALAAAGRGVGAGGRRRRRRQRAGGRGRRRWGRAGERARSARRGHYAASVRRRWWPRHARFACRALVASPGFEGLVLGVILLSSVLLALANPLMDPDSAFYRLLSKTDLALTAIFGIEILIKLYAMGAKEYLLGKGRGWNALDVGIVALGAAAGVLPDASSLTSIRSLRALRALRPLRLIQRYPGLKQVVNTMLEAVPSISNVLLVLCFFFLIFGIMGTTYFKGAFDHCNFDMVSTDVYSALEAEYGFTVGTFRKAFTKADCLAAGGAWEKALDQHFDNVGRSMMTLYEISTLENWVGIMHAGIDAVGVERHPVENYRRAWALYFVFFVIVGNFFAMNLFVGAVIENYQKQKREDSTGLATPTQKAWIDAQRLMARAELVARRRVPRHPARALAYRLVTLPGFDLAVMALVAANALVMMLRRTGEPAAQAAVVAAANSLFTLAFLAELALKLLAHGPRWPLRSGWNAFDAGVVAFASGAWLADGGGFFGGGGRLNAVAVSARVARVLLLFRLVRRARTLRALTEVVLQELPSIFNVLTLIFLVLFIFAVLGVNLFAAVVLQTELNAHANFQSFGRAFLTLFRFSGGEAWNAVMYELMVREDGTGSYLPGGTSCVPNPTHTQMAAAWEEAGDRTFMIGCGAPAPWAYLFFLAFTLLTAFIMINLFVAIIVDAVGDSSRREENPLGAEAFQEFCIKWNDIDEDATYTLAVEDLLTFVEKI